MIRQLRSVPQEIQSIAYLANSVKIRAGTRNFTHFKNLENFLRRKKVPAEIRRTPTLREIRPKQKSNETSICKADYNTCIRTVSTFSLSRGSCPRREGAPARVAINGVGEKPSPRGSQCLPCRFRQGHFSVVSLRKIPVDVRSRSVAYFSNLCRKIVASMVLCFL